MSEAAFAGARQPRDFWIPWSFFDSSAYLVVPVLAVTSYKERCKQHVDIWLAPRLVFHQSLQHYNTGERAVCLCYDQRWCVLEPVQLVYCCSLLL